MGIELQRYLQRIGPAGATDPVLEVLHEHPGLAGPVDWIPLPRGLEEVSAMTNSMR